MSTEPERDIEKTLKAYAKQRREEPGARLELHPATRRLLQAEVVKRVSKEPKRDGFMSAWSSLLRRRLAYVSIFAALALVCALWFAPARRQTAKVRASKAPAPSMQLAQKDKEAEVQLKQTPASESATRLPVGDGLPRKQDKALAAKRELTRNEGNVRQNAATDFSGGRGETLTVVPPAAPPPATPPAASASGTLSGVPRESDALRRRYGMDLPTGTIVSTNGVAPADNKLASATPAGSSIDNRKVAAAGSFAPAPAAVTATQWYFHTGLGPAVAAKPRLGKVVQVQSAGVLNSFRLERNSNQVRIVDADGSIYSGSVQTPSPAQESYALGSGEFKSQLSDTAKEPDSTVPSNPLYSFQASGTNRSLNQLVNFSGFVTAADTAVERDRAAGASNAAPVLQLQGHALVGGTNRLDVKAVTAGAGGR